MKDRIPVTLIGGYLGSGKTTLVNHLLRHAGGLRLAVLVNDFGALPIDADLIEARDEDVIAIAGGCICCSFGSDLVEAMARLAERRPAPDHVLIETSGVSLPGPVAGTVSLLPGFEIDCVAVLADAAAIRQLSDDRFLADTIARQLADAQVLLMTKADLLDDNTGAVTLDWLAARAPRAICLPVRHGRVDPAVLIGARLGYRAAPALKSGAGGAVAFVTDVLSLPDPVDIGVLKAVLSQAELGILRAKGVVRDRQGRLCRVQGVGATVRIDLHDGRFSGTAALVIIARRGRFDGNDLRSRLAAGGINAG